MISAGVQVSPTGSVSVQVAAARYDHATLSLKNSLEPPLHCQFNPTEYTVTKTAKWTRIPMRNAPNAATPEFVGTNGATLSLELFFDGRQEGSPEVADAVDRLLSWTQPTARSIDDKRPTPPVICFEWGGTASFDAYLSSASARFVLFRRDGSPLRAHVSLRLEEVPRLLTFTNPTSGSDVLVRERTVTAGDTLALIAFEEYGRADAWRAIAEASDVDDPARLTPGTRLVIPEASGLGRRPGRAR